MEEMKSRDEASRKVKAIGLLSGGLDSTLAAAVVKRAGIEVIGLYVKNMFVTDRRREEHLRRAVDQLGIPLRVIDRSNEHLNVVRHPRYGYGSGMNPCVDCRIFILRTAKEVMEEEGAQFVVTGEVLGQRPMSQHRRALLLVARESGLGDRLLRPLSANLLPETLPVREGWLDKGQLYSISGRSRAPQRALADALGITDYPQPAGGCLLTEKVYSARLRDAFSHLGADALDREGFELLRHGRHFRLGESVKVIIGRNEAENEILSEFKPGRIALEPLGVMGPLALVEGDPTPEQLRLAAALVARYCDRADQVEFAVTRGDETIRITVSPLTPDDPRIDAWRI